MSKSNSRKLWQGRITKDASKLLEKFNNSLSFDKKLYTEDITGSIAHTETLLKAKILTKNEAKKIIDGLKKIKSEIEKESHWFMKHAGEDIHSVIETRLCELIGETGKKLHTGRSRNDQVITDTRLYLKNETKEIISLLKSLIKTFLTTAQKHTETIIPGYTHLQAAQPITLGHYFHAHAEKLTRDLNRFKTNLNNIDISPLGSGALAGVTYNLDRSYTAKLLGFKSISKNSLDAVSDRDFICESLFNISLLGIHLSQFAEEMVLWNNQEFNFIEINDRYATGSSMMPQKKNPDIPELIRGKSGRFIGNLNTLLIVLKGLPLAYNKDLQEDKEPLFDSVENIKVILKVTNEFVQNITFNKNKMLKSCEKGFICATDIADYLVKQGIPFRTAYQTVGEIISYCIKKKKVLSDLSLKEWGAFNSNFKSDIKNFLNPISSVKRRKAIGGTAPENVKKAILLSLQEISS